MTKPWGSPEDESYYEAAEAHVARNEVLLDGVVNAGIGFYLRRLGRTPAKLAEDVSLMERLEMLERLVAESTKDPEAIQVFTTDVQLCRDAELLRGRTKAKYETRGENTWLLELADVGDWLATAAHELDGSLLCGHEEGDYRSPFSPS